MNFARSSLYKAAAVLLAALLVLAAGCTVSAGPITFRFDKPASHTASARDIAKQKTAKAVAAEMQVALATFRSDRLALHLVQRGGSPPAYRRADVILLIDRARQDLPRTIKSTWPGEMEALADWVSGQIHGIQGALDATPGTARVAWHGDSTPRVVAAVASLGARSRPSLAAAKPTPQAETVPVETSNRLLDRVEGVITRIFTLATHRDLWVRVWVGSSPPQSMFSFWPFGQMLGQGQAAKPHIIKTDGDEEVLRGLWQYKATTTKGAITEVIECKNPASTSQAQNTSEPLDLVNGTSFFCCRFEDHYCQHVADEKACPP
ncbi:MAG TPA: hypothetical protein VGE98_05195 [Thermoanaerobaculia bacterium]